MNVLETIRTRRSVRKYEDKPVPAEMLDKIAEAGIWAASGMGTQGPIVVIITDKAVRDRVSELNAAVMGRPGDPFYGAPVILMVLADKSIPTHIYDGSLMLGNLMNAAHSLGLGSIWIHRCREEFEQDGYKKMLADLGVTGDYEGIGHLAVGYTDGDAPAALPRKDGRVYWCE